VDFLGELVVAVVAVVAVDTEGAMGRLLQDEAPGPGNEGPSAALNSEEEEEESLSRPRKSK